MSNIKLDTRIKVQTSYWIFILPAVVIFFLFRFWPSIYGFFLSFFEVNIVDENTFVGLKNYIDLLKDKSYLQSLRVTAIYTLINVPLSIAWALLISLLLDYKHLKYSNFFRGLFFMPYITSWVVVSIIWKWFLNYKFGIVNQVLNLLHIPGQQWLSDKSITLWVIMLIGIWKGSGLNILIFSANLQMIDPTLYEAAELDGANFWHKFRYIILSSLKPAFYVALITGTVLTFRTFSAVYIMTSGGPQGSTDLLAFHTYQLAFNSYKFGQANASVVFMFIIISIVLIIQVFLLERKQ